MYGGEVLFVENGFASASVSVSESIMPSAMCYDRSIDCIILSAEDCCVSAFKYDKMRSFKVAPKVKCPSLWDVGLDEDVSDIQICTTDSEALIFVTCTF